MSSNPSSRRSSGGTALNSLQKKLSNTVIDYSPWTRQQQQQQRRPSKSAPTKTKLTAVVELPPVRDENKCSELCRHLRKETVHPDFVIPENPVKIQWLTLQLHMHQTRIDTFLRREDELIATNTKLRQTISNVEHSAHDQVSTTLRRFDQYKKTISLVETKQNEEKEELLNATDHERQMLANEVETYENEVLSLDNQLSDCQQLLKQLKTYKDSEYPEKERVLQQLLEEINEKQLFHSEEVDQLNRILDKQQEQYTENLRQTVAQLREEQATTAFSGMHKSYLLVALDNDHIREEIAIQEEQVRLLEIEIEHIRKLNGNLKQDNKKAFDSRTLFPHVFRHTTMPICTPDMDVILDLPERRSPLPV